MAKYDTGMAAEFYVLSMLYRLGASANLTLGNQKSVDIVVVRSSGEIVTIDVKGIRGKGSWPIRDNCASRSHYYVFVSFLDRIYDPQVLPEVYVVPSISVRNLKAVHKKSGREFVQVRKLRAKSKRYQDNWDVLL